jgi:demethylmenaquinone methyltransferase/2-methoxy-6-polyprenyl-1,4-benzoquinol methylase
MQALREPALRAAMHALGLPPCSRGIDIGCGIGDVTALLADAAGPGGHVTGLDLSLPLLDYARRRGPLSKRSASVVLVQGDMNRLPCARDAYDWASSVDCVGYPAGDLLPTLMGIARAVRPGGIVALLGWTSQQLLPGHETLEARLNAQCSPYAAFYEGQLPQAHFQRALHAFRQAGFTESTCRTFQGLVRAPLRPDVRRALALLFDMLWAGSIQQASEPDRQELRRLCSPSSPDFIGDAPEYWGSFTYTMFLGKVPIGP